MKRVEIRRLITTVTDERLQNFLKDLAEICRKNSLKIKITEIEIIDKKPRILEDIEK